MCLSIADLFKSSKNAAWREQVVKRRTVMFQFLRDNGLILIDPIDDSGAPRQEFVLMRSHLTDDGFEMIKKVIPSWRKARDRDGNIENIGILEKGTSRNSIGKVDRPVDLGVDDLRA